MKKILSYVILVFGIVIMFPAVSVQATTTTYKITYKANGGSGADKVDKVESGKQHTFRKNTTFSRTGYKLSKWNTKKDGKGTSYACGKKITVKQNYTVYAQWTAKTFTVSYNVNGGNALSPASKTVTYAATYGTLPTPSRTGYNFAGWYTAASGGSQVSAATKVTITANQTLYAHWTPKTFTVSYNPNGGNAISPASKTVTYAATYGALPTPSRTGYTFTGWYTAASGGSQVSAATMVTILANQTLYAHWNENSYTIQFLSQDMSGGYHDASITGEMKSQTQKYTDMISLNQNTFTKPGYYFYSWNTKPDGTGVSYKDGQTVSRLASSGTLYLYAIFRANDYTILFDKNGGNGTDQEPQTVAYDKILQLQYIDWTKKGYGSVDSLNTKQDGTGTKITFDRTQLQVKDYAEYANDKNEIVLYAQYVPNQYTISFNISMYDDVDLNSPNEEMEVTYDKKVGKMPQPTRKYYDFLGWYTEEENDKGSRIAEDSLYQYADDVELYPHWKIKNYTITYNANKGKFAKNENTKKTLPALSKLGRAPKVTRKNYILSGWYWIKDQKKQKIADITTATIGRDLTVYAEWKKVTVKKPQKITAKWDKKKPNAQLQINKVNGADGYIIQYSTNSKFKKAAKKTVKASKGKTKVTLKRLKKNQKYYIRVQAYKLDSQKNKVKSKWKKYTLNKY